MVAATAPASSSSTSASAVVTQTASVSVIGVPKCSTSASDSIAEQLTTPSDPDHFVSNHERNRSDGCRSTTRGLVGAHVFDEPWFAMRPSGFFAARVESQQQSNVGAHARGLKLLLPPPHS